MGTLGWKHAAWSLATLLAIVVLACAAVFASWFIAAGASGGYDATLRFIRHGSTTIDDFKHYPARHLRASKSPWRFAEGANDGRVPEIVELGANGRASLEDVLAASGIDFLCRIYLCLCACNDAQDCLRSNTYSQVLQSRRLQ